MASIATFVSILFERVPGGLGATQHSKLAGPISFEELIDIDQLITCHVFPVSVHLGQDSRYNNQSHLCTVGEIDQARSAVVLHPFREHRADSTSPSVTTGGTSGMHRRTIIHEKASCPSVGAPRKEFKELFHQGAYVVSRHPQRVERDRSIRMTLCNVAHYTYPLAQ
ncbi:hypothetical protein [Ferrimicrobium sp.]|uniref:hypothetical protein n=1 Tax=Ferrimicrobium sp. TaxID=2926050 RepID=UPI0026342FE7|nr:hypothetical protein [Ferrimicrobium sp.]